MAAVNPVPRAVVFDCDGVLIESVSIKTEAFVELFAEYPEHADAIARHHLDHLGISRFEKFRWISRELLGRELAEDDLQDLGRRFSALVDSAARSCPEVAGTSATLAALDAAGVPLYIASGTPQGELEALIEARGWRSHFTGVHGSPATKPEILARIAAELEGAPEDLLFVGDGRSDHDAAVATGARFVLRTTRAQEELFRQYQGARIVDLVGFPALLPELASPGAR